MIGALGLNKSFGKNKVLEDLNISFEPGKISALLGPNSCGKTTIIKCLLGMVIPDSGEIIFDEKIVTHQPEYRNNIGYLPQIARFPEHLKVKELFILLNDLRNATANYRILIDYFELEPFMNESLGHLSGGTRQKVNLVQAFMFDSPYMILDEPTVGLDPLALIRLKKLIHKESSKGKTFLITSHIMSFVQEISDLVMYILEGKLQFSISPKELMRQYQSANLEEAIAEVLKNEKVLLQKRDMNGHNEIFNLISNQHA